MAFKMKGPSLYKGIGGMGAKGAIKNQKDYAGQADGRATSSPFQHTDTVEEGTNRDARYAAKHNKKHTDGWKHGEVGSEDNKWTPPADKKTPLEQTVGGGIQPAKPTTSNITNAMSSTVGSVASAFPQRVTKGGEGQDENKIFDKDGNHVGDWVDGKRVMKKTAGKRTMTKNIKTKK